MLLSVCTEGDGLYVIQASSLSISSNTPPRFFTPRTPTFTWEHIQGQILQFLKTNINIVNLNFCCVFLVTSRRPDRLSAGRETASEGLPLQSLGTKATKHASVNISVASAPHPGSCCSLSAGPQCEPLCVPWQTVLCCAAGHGWSVVGRQQCLHACSSRGED